MPLISNVILQSVSIALCMSLAHGQSLPERIEVVVIQGEGAVNSIRRRCVAPPIVLVRQGAGQPVAGASVVFTLPTEGATGDFDGEKTMILSTNAEGRAAVKSLKLNALPGKVPIHVTASYRGLTARTVINQVTVVPQGEKAGKASSKGGHGALIAVLLSLGAAAGGATAYVMTQNKQQGSSPSTPVPPGPVPIGITPGTGTIAGGR